MRILFLTHRLPYAPNRGDRVRAFHIESTLRQFTQIWALDRHTSSRTDLREQPRVRTKSRVRRYFPVLRSRTIGPP